MAFIPEEVQQAWKNREGPAILATVGKNGEPNIVFVTCVAAFGDDKLVIADNYFFKTQKNILLGSKGSLLFRSKDDKAFQLKGTFEYHKKGELFDYMKSWNPSQHPGHAAAVLLVEDIYAGAEKLS